MFYQIFKHVVSEILMWVLGRGYYQVLRVKNKYKDNIVAIMLEMHK